MEYLLLHEFHIRKFILPDKLSQKEKEKEVGKRKASAQSDRDVPPDGEDGDNRDAGLDNATAKKGKKGPAYLGGLVLEPKKGLYDKYILLLDFNSLYPSIIQVHPTSSEPNRFFLFLASKISESSFARYRDSPISEYAHHLFLKYSTALVNKF